MDLTKSLVWALLDKGVEGLLLNIFQFWQQPIQVVGGACSTTFLFFSWLPPCSSSTSLFTLSSCIFLFLSSSSCLLASLFLAFWVHKRIAPLDLRVAFYALRPVTAYQSDTSMRSPSTNGSASRETRGGAWCGRDTPHPLGDRYDLMLDQWERIT